MTTALFTPLTDLQEAFVGEYLIDYNASAAARRAGYSPKTHGAQSAALMKNPAVRARIDIGIKAMRERLGVCAMNAWQERVFIFMFRNASNPIVFFGIPTQQAMEIGTLVEL